MSSRSPMWFCHECHAEMRPLMAPDPVCASCRGSFVEKIEDPQDDPRHFSTRDGGPHAAPDSDPGISDFLIAMDTLLNRGMEPVDHPFHRPPPQPSSRLAFQFGNVSGHPRRATFTFGHSSPPPGLIPSMSQFVRSPPSPFPHDDIHTPRHGPQINGQLFTQYLMSLLGQTNHPMMHQIAGSMPEAGRMGDYVFSQDALDQIITQIMDSTNSNRPVPATEEIIEKLPREILVVDSPLLTKDCAVCKDQFQLGTEDPESQIVLTLPCKHPFHEACILPWLKSSGTCPVCRYALVPQPGQQTSPTNNAVPSSSSSPRSNNNDARPRSQSPSSYQHRSPRPTPTSVPNPGNFSSFFGRHYHRPSNSFPRPSASQPSSPNPRPGERTSSTSRSGSRNDPSRGGQDSRPHFPGQWTDDMDLD